MEEKVTVLLVKFDDLEKNLLAKPCPSPECYKCRADIAELKVINARHLSESENAINDLRVVEEKVTDFEAWKVKRETAILKEAEDEDEANSHEAWFIPLIILGIIEAAGILLSVAIWLSG